MVRVRFAPSPTGYLHVGNARTALFNWLFARKNKGTFILRIEDTDIERSSEVYTEHIIADLRWLGLEWDEGPDIGGAHGPYKQSDRLSIYDKYAKKLLEDGSAYYCYCSPEELEERRKEALARSETPRYDNRCRKISTALRKEFEMEGRRAAIRFKVTGGEITIRDLIRGEVSFDAGLMGDFIIMKSDGTPSFNFAVTIDDALMEITHIIRGEDHLSNTPRHLMLFERLGFKVPQIAHLPMLHGEDHARLSKRKEDVSVTEYRDKGYLPEAIVNYLALLGWSPGNGKELLKLEEMKEQFDIERVNKSPAIFDTEKLDWISGHYIRSSDLDRITSLSLSYLKENGLIQGEIKEDEYERIKKVLNIIRDNISCISEVPYHAEIVFKEELKMEDDAAKLLMKTESQKVLNAILKLLEKDKELDGSSFKDLIKEAEKDLGVKGKNLYMPLRAAWTGRLHGPELANLLPILGRERCRMRIKRVICPSL